MFQSILVFGYLNGVLFQWVTTTDGYKIHQFLSWLSSQTSYILWGFKETATGFLAILYFAQGSLSSILQFLIPSSYYSELCLIQKGCYFFSLLFSDIGFHMYFSYTLSNYCYIPIYIIFLFVQSDGCYFCDNLSLSPLKWSKTIIVTCLACDWKGGQSNWEFSLPNLIDIRISRASKHQLKSLNFIYKQHPTSSLQLHK